MIQVDPRGQDESLRRGSGEGWAIYDEYVIQNGFLLPKAWHPDHLNPKHERRMYFPLGMPEIVTEFQNIKSEDENDLLRFVHSYGFLGHWRFYEEHPKEPWLDAEPLEWIWWHHRTIRMVFDFVDGIRRRDDEALFKTFNRFGVLNWEGGVLSFRFQFAVRNTYQDRERRSESFDPEGIETLPEFLAKWIITDIVNDNTTSVRRQLLHDPGRPLWSSVRYEALIEVMYWHLMDIVDSGRQLGRCKFCNGFFLKTNARQEFCPPPAYSVAQKRVSLCGAKYHNRTQQRKRNKGQ